MVFEAEKSAIAAKLQGCQNPADVASLNGRLQLIVIKSDDLVH